MQYLELCYNINWSYLSHILGWRDVKWRWRSKFSTSTTKIPTKILFCRARNVTLRWAVRFYAVYGHYYFFFFLVENYGLDLTLVRFVIDMTCSFFFFLVIFNKFCKLCVMIGHSFRWFYFISFYFYFTKIDINK